MALAFKVTYVSNFATLLSLMNLRSIACKCVVALCVKDKTLHAFILHVNLGRLDL